jgi:hypothetical protein
MHRVIVLAFALVVAGCGAAVTPTGSPTPTSSIDAGAASDAASGTPTPTPDPTPTPKPTPGPTPKPTPLAPPPPPDSAKLSQRPGAKDKYGTPAVVSTVTWDETYAPGTTIRVYGVTECLATANYQPCLKTHTALPSKVRRFIAAAPAADGRVRWTWPGWEDIGGAVAADAHGRFYYAIVVAAYNKAGHSKFIIVDTSTSCDGCVY